MSAVSLGRMKARTALPALRPTVAAISVADSLSHARYWAFEQITGIHAAEERADRQVASLLVERGAQAAVLKTGARGSVVVSAEGEIARVEIDGSEFEVPFSEVATAASIYEFTREDFAGKSETAMKLRNDKSALERA